MVDVKVITGSAVRANDGRTGRVASVSLPWIRFAWDVPGEVSAKEEALLRSDPRLDSNIEILTLDRGWCAVGQLVGAREQEESSTYAESVSPELYDELEGLLSERSRTFEKRTKAVKKSRKKSARKAAKADIQAGLDDMAAEKAEAEAEKAKVKAPKGVELSKTDKKKMLDSQKQAIKVTVQDKTGNPLRDKSTKLTKRQRENIKSSGKSGGSSKYNPFKRKRNLGPGPRGHVHSQSGDWACDKKGAYSQMCIGVKGEYKGEIRDIWIDSLYKKGYNSEYKAWLKGGAPTGKGPYKRTAFGPRKGPNKYKEKLGAPGGMSYKVRG